MASTLPALLVSLSDRFTGFRRPGASFAFMMLGSALTLALSFLVHQVPEGHVGVYWRGGALLNTTTRPGLRLKYPLLTRFEAVQVTMQSNSVEDIPCGTKGGVILVFDKIEVVHRLLEDFVIETLRDYGLGYDNRWILDKIHREVNEFCTSHSLQQVYVDVFNQIDDELKDALQADCTRYAPGIEIISVRVTKPTIPERIRWQYEDMELKRIELYEDGRDTDDQKQSTADLTVFVQNLVQMLRVVICFFDSDALGEMGSLIDRLEQSISDLRAEMEQKGSPPSAAPKPKEEPKLADDSA
ncbi:hypothetical protein RHGRI_024840 [Rhododendron griersonianum]|uniref:Band 7 domain-containing protein n=1 Tax=Rhododendron griersonianum TaxID=479676 RepID=A0AAV6JE64_9ERIC|nr:hypothetical protein RHGRI_024840 [Rhododendron griersonianum]